MKPIYLFAFLFLIGACTSTQNRRITYDANGKKDSVIVFLDVDTLAIPDMSGVLHEYRLAKFKNYDNGKLVSSGMLPWGDVRYYQTTFVIDTLPNGNYKETQYRGGEIEFETLYSTNRNKIYFNNKRKNRYVTYDAMGQIDTVKFDIRIDTIMVPSLSDPEDMAMYIYNLVKYKNYDNKKLVSAGTINFGKPCGDVFYYNGKKVIKTEKLPECSESIQQSK